MKETRARRSPFHRAQANFRVAQSEGATEILLYDEIGYFGVTAEDFRRELATVGTPEITLRINSPGGEIFDSIAIYNALREHPARVTTRIDGIAASMASVIALAGETVEIADNAFMMVHNPWSIVIGNAEDMRKEADILEKLGGSLVSAYVEKTGKDEAEVRALMDAETWLNADEAVAAGLADTVIGSGADEAMQAAALFDLSIFANLPDGLREQPKHDPTTRELERALRDAGLSQVAAKAYVSAGREAATQRDAEEAEGRDVTSEPVHARTRTPVRGLTA